MTGNDRGLMSDAEGVREDQAMVSELEAARLRLRQRWELASVLNFLKVFEPVIKSNLKISAEEIETALIEPTKLLAQLHIVLLKGIPPVCKTLNGSDAWVAALCRKLTMWWPWVAEGGFPLTAAKGAEIARYRGLDPTIRLMILKALCEIRADQDDTVSYINDAIKNGTELSTFRKDKIGGDGNGTAYWYDGNAIIGHRLYKEVNTLDCKPMLGEDEPVPTINSQWETLATNLEEFQRVLDEFSSSESKMEVAVSKAVETEAIPALIKIHKKRERALKQHQRQERLISGFRSSGITRSCRTRRPITYTFDEYDKAIDEAIQQTKKRKTKGDQNHVRTETASNEDSGQDTKRRESESTGTDTESDRLEADDVDDTSGEEYVDEEFDNDNDKENKNLGYMDDAMLNSWKQIGGFAQKPKGSRWSKRVAGHPDTPTRNLGAKNRLRQRPNRNTALESAIVPDSEDGSSSENSDS